MIEFKADENPIVNIHHMRDSASKQYLSEPNKFFQGVQFVLSVYAVGVVVFLVIFLVG